jgi:hypothetical protein
MVQGADIQITFEVLLRRFESCSTAIGYCLETGRTKLADELQDELMELGITMQFNSAGWMDELLRLVSTTSNPWVQFHSLVVIAKVEPRKAIDGLRFLADAEIGFVSADAFLALSILQSGRA